MGRKSLVRVLFVALIAAAISQVAFAEEVVHAISGVVSRVDSATKTIFVKASDGTEHAFKFTEKTAVHAGKMTAMGVKTGTADTYFAGKEGTHVVVHYTGEGADRTAVAFRDLGKDTVKVSKGTITHVDKDAHTVTVKTEGGAEETYQLGKDASIDTEHGVVDGTKYVAKEGEKVTVHYTESAGKKVAHFITHL